MIHLLRVVEEMYGHWWLGQSRWNRVGLWLSKIRVTDRKLCRSLGHEELLGVVGETYIIALFEAALLSAPAIAVTSHGSHGVPNHRQIDCMFSSLFEIATTKRVKHCITDPLCIRRYSMVSPHKGAVMMLSLCTSSGSLFPILQWASSIGLTVVNKSKPRLPAQWAIGTHRKDPSRMKNATIETYVLAGYFPCGVI